MLKKITEFFYWIEKISWKSIFLAMGGIIIAEFDADSFLLNSIFILSGWNMVLWAIAREIKIREPKIGE